MGRNDLNDWVGAESSMVQFLGGTRGVDVARIQPYVVADVEGWGRRPHVVRGQFVGGDGDLELFSKVGVETGQVFRHLRHLRAGDLFDIDRNRGVIPFVGEEGGCTGRRLWSVVVRELRQGEDVGPIVLLLIDVHPEVLFEDLIGALRLAVSFRVVRRTKI